MSAIVVLAPALVAAWPTVAASVVGAAAALGFAQTTGAPKAAKRQECVSLEVKGSQVVTDGLALDERLSFVKGEVTVTFARDARGACNVGVAGSGHERRELEAIGKEFGERVVQQYAYHRLMEELGAQNFAVVSQEVGEDRTIHVSVRRFD